MEQRMRATMKWGAWGMLLAAIFSGPFIRTNPEGIGIMLSTISQHARSFSLIVHILFVLVIIGGLFVARIRNPVNISFMVLITLSAALQAVVHEVLPNAISFLLILVLIIHAYYTKRLNWRLKFVSAANLIVGIMSLVCGFWYLHWVEPPIWLNALLYSPVGAVNCPTLVTLCGFLVLNDHPRPVMLEATVALTTLFSAAVGLFMLKAYIDVILIISSLFLLVRLGAYFDIEGRRKL